MANNLCDECQRISIDALRSYWGFEHSSLLRNIDFGISSECALCSEIEKDLPQYIVRERLNDNVRYKRRRVRFHVHPDQIDDLFVTVGCPPEDIIWTRGRRLDSKSGRVLVRSFRIFADRGMWGFLSSSDCLDATSIFVLCNIESDTMKVPPRRTYANTKIPFRSRFRMKLST
jgi:hypothetical protein